MFNPALDKVIAKEDILTVSGKGSIEVKIAAYNGGEPKIGLNKCFDKADGTSVLTPIGRIAIADWDNIVAAVARVREVAGRKPVAKKAVAKKAVVRKSA